MRFSRLNELARASVALLETLKRIPFSAFCGWTAAKHWLSTMTLSLVFQSLFTFFEFLKRLVDLVFICKFKDTKSILFVLQLNNSKQTGYYCYTFWSISKESFDIHQIKVINNTIVMTNISSKCNFSLYGSKVKCTENLANQCKKCSRILSSCANINLLVSGSILVSFVSRKICRR